MVNKHLFLWNKRQDDKCSFCDEEVETIQHLLFECHPVKELWDQLIIFLANSNQISY